MQEAVKFKTKGKISVGTIARRLELDLDDDGSLLDETDPSKKLGIITDGERGVFKIYNNGLTSKMLRRSALRFAALVT